MKPAPKRTRHDRADRAGDCRCVGGAASKSATYTAAVSASVRAEVTGPLLAGVSKSATNTAVVSGFGPRGGDRSASAQVSRARVTQRWALASLCAEVTGPLWCARSRWSVPGWSAGLRRCRLVSVRRVAGFGVSGVSSGHTSHAIVSDRLTDPRRVVPLRGVYATGRHNIASIGTPRGYPSLPVTAARTLRRAAGEVGWPSGPVTAART